MTDKKRKTGESRAKGRPKRTPLHKKRLLDAKQRPGYVRRWVNEEVGAIDMYLDAGWQPVVGDEDASDKRAQTESKLGSVVRRVVNRDPNASAKTAILMEIPEDIYNEVQAMKQDDIAEKEASYDPRQRNQHGADYGEMKKSYS